MGAFFCNFFNGFEINVKFCIFVFLLWVMLALFANKPNAAKMAKNIKKEFCKDDSESNMASIRGSVLDPSFSSKKVKIVSPYCRIT